MLLLAYHLLPIACTLPTDCGGDTCSEACCPKAERASDPYCPNCKGSDFACLATRNQSGLGQTQAKPGLALKALAEHGPA